MNTTTTTFTSTTFTSTTTTTTTTAIIILLLLYMYIYIYRLLFKLYNLVCTHVFFHFFTWQQSKKHDPKDEIALDAAAVSSIKLSIFRFRFVT